MSDELVRSVLVVGGGTSGWMTGAYLAKAFGSTVRVTVLESPVISKIGVGEATIPNLQKVLFDFLGIPEDEWMREVNGSFKTAVKFINWGKPQPGKHNHFFHPFGILPYVDGIPLPQYWFHLTQGRGKAYDYSCFREPVCMDAKLSPKFLDGRTALPHAWHFDAHLVADFLMRWSKERGVEHILDEVKNTSLDERGHIASVTLASGRELKADLYVDCTGFRGLLINQALGEPFINMKDYLLCDSAVAASVAHDDDANGIEPYTSAIAMRAGWTWKIPMLTRFGSGYVYSSNFATEDEATRDFCALWGLDASRTQFNRIRFRAGRNRRAWVNNCVSIGLSSCFLEPLESTGIFFITAAIHQLAKHFPTRAMDEKLIARFNREIEIMFDDCRDFVQAHYVMNTRDDTDFWITNRNELTISDQMREKMEIYRTGLPVNAPLTTEGDYYNNFENEFRNFFTNGSYYCIFAGSNFLPERPLGRLSYRPEAIAEAEEVFARIRAQQQELLQTLPTMVGYLRHLHAETRSADRSPVNRRHAAVL